MEVQETIPGATRMNSQSIKVMKVKDRLHPELRRAFIPEMVHSLSDSSTNHFINKANDAYDRGILEGLKTFICYSRARQFLLWMSHQSIDINNDCKYCPFLDSIYGLLDEFLYLPKLLENTEVTTT